MGTTNSIMLNIVLVILKVFIYLSRLAELSHIQPYWFKAQTICSNPKSPDQSANILIKGQTS